MPIRPENRARYPADWKAIRAEVLARAGNCCEGTPNYPGCRAANGQPHPDTGSRVVLTIMHMDHQPENNGTPGDRPNLRAGCQRCHLDWDKDHHAETARATRRARLAARDLFAMEAA